jgi:hypothetical protein
MRILSHRLLTLVILLSAVYSWAQPSPIKMERYNDDFSFLQNDTVVKKGLEKLKYISTGSSKDSYISFGGEVRGWYELRKNPNFGDLPPGQVEVKNGTYQHRLMLHADWNINKKLRFFTQINNTLEFGNPNPPIPEIIVDGLGVHQAFLEIQFSKNFALRAGRQEYSFGNELLISSREGPNNRQPFDGLTLLANGDNHNTEFFVATPVIINPELFDNTHINEWMWGAYTELKPKKEHRLDVYYLGFYSERRAFNFIPGNQHRHSFGTRLWKHTGNWFYDADFVYQTGNFNAQLINAWNATGEVRYVFQNAKWKPMVGLGASYVSGDYNANDNQLNTYDPMYPKPVYGLAMPQGPSNISHIRPVFGLAPLPQLFINFNWYWLTRASNQDGTYTPSMIQVRPFPEMNSDKYIVGTQYSLDIFYTINKNLMFITFLSYVDPGAYIKETGSGLPTFFWASMLQFKF